MIDRVDKLSLMICYHIILKIYIEKKPQIIYNMPSIPFFGGLYFSLEFGFSGFVEIVW